MSSQPPQSPHFDRYVVIHVATTCDEHGVYVTKDSAEVIELGWILLDAKTLDEVRFCHAYCCCCCYGGGGGGSSNSSIGGGAGGCLPLAAVARDGDRRTGSRLRWGFG